MKFSPTTKRIGRVSYVICIVSLTFCSVAVVHILYLLGTAYETALLSNEQPDLTYTIQNEISPFPVSVNSNKKSFTPDPDLERFLNSEIATTRTQAVKISWWRKVEHVVLQSGLFQQLASLTSRVVVIWPGDRKEEITETVGNILKWDAAERQTFLEQMSEMSVVEEGTYLPGTYVVQIDTKPEDIAYTISQQFQKDILSRYTPDVDALVPLSDALIIASLLEREAYSFEHMQIISGVIWSRLFIDMPLQIDATLQYVRGGNPSEPWWPVPVPEDKYLKSPYNTYLNKGLPPAPIANPSIEAIVAALNPIASDCLFYFHSDDGELYCSKTYEEHVDSLRALYGQGR